MTYQGDYRLFDMSQVRIGQTQADIILIPITLNQGKTIAIVP